MLNRIAVVMTSKFLTPFLLTIFTNDTTYIFGSFQIEVFFCQCNFDLLSCGIVYMLLSLILLPSCNNINRPGKKNNCSCICCSERNTKWWRFKGQKPVVSHVIQCKEITHHGICCELDTARRKIKNSFKHLYIGYMLKLWIYYCLLLF